jgi:hypothetical protein
MDYAIRVELRGSPTYQTYETLHAVMKKMGFYQSLNGIDVRGTTRSFDLPHAVYYGSSTQTCAAVRDAVVKAVKAHVQENIIVFVVQAATWALG